MDLPRQPSNDSLCADLVSLLRSERQRMGLTQVDVASLAGVTRQTVIAIEAGGGVSSTSLLSVMDVVGLTFARKPVTAQRPRLKELMRAERERHGLLRGGSSFDGLRDAGRRASESLALAAPVGPVGARPSLKSMMAAERARHADLRVAPA